MDRGHKMNYKDVDEALKLAGILIEKEQVEKKIEKMELNQKLRNERKTKSK